MKKLTYLLLLVSFQFYGQGLKLTPKEELKTFTKLPVLCLHLGQLHLHNKLLSHQ